MEIVKLIVKKITSRLSKAEEKELETWLSMSIENKEVFDRIVHIHKSGKDIRELESLDEDAAWDRILSRTRKKETVGKKMRFPQVFRYAAVIIGIAMSLAVYQYLSKPVSEENTVPVNRNAITLQLENGKIIELSEEGSSQIKSQKGSVVAAKNESNLTYSSSTSVDRLLYNTLTVPYAKRFGITLSDGTRVQLNSGSSIKYPIKFVGAQREVFLTGEAFFEVAEDSLHPFIVASGDLMVEVLGTTFNVTAYPEDMEINTVLVSGSVGLSSSHDTSAGTTLLEPGYKASWNKAAMDIALEAVDTELYTSWVSGRLLLKRTAFGRILPKLERHYDISITNNYPALNNKVFTASYDIETITEVMKSLSEIVPFDFEVNGRNIIINPPKNQTNLKSSMPMK